MHIMKRMIFDRIPNDYIYHCGWRST